MTTIQPTHFTSIARHKEVWMLAWPIILSNLSVPLLGAVDTAVVGHLPSPHYLGAVAIAAMIFNYLYWGFGFLRMGTTGFIAQATGRNDADELRSIIARGLILATVFSALIWIFQSLVTQVSFGLLEASEAVESGAQTYFDVRIWGAPAALANYCLLGFFIGRKNTRVALYLQLVMNGINIVLDLVFVLLLGMEIAGVAVATVIAEYSAVVLGLYFLRKELVKIGGRWIKSAILNLQEMKELMSVNFDIFVRNMLLIIAFSYVTAQAAKIDDVTLAAFAVLINFIHFMAYGLDGFAHAAEGLIGTSIGAKNRNKLRVDVLVCNFWALIVSLLFTLVYWIAGAELIGLLTNVVEVRNVAEEFLPWMIISPIIAVWSFTLDGIFVGAMQTKAMRNGMVISFIAFFVGCHLFTQVWGAHGLWLAIMTFFAMRAITLAYAYPSVERQAVA